MTIETLSGGKQKVVEHRPNDILEMALEGKDLPRGLSELEAKILIVRTLDDISEEARKQGIANWINNFSEDNGMVVARYDSLIKIDITDEEASRALEFTGGREYHIGGIGYVDPERIISYYCTKCDKEYSGAPKIDVFIDVLPSSLENSIGSVIGRCNTCDDAVIMTCPVWEGQTPDVKYIDTDNSGKFIPIKIEDIDTQLKKAREHANENGNLQCSSFGLAKKLSKNAGYDIEEKLTELKEFAEKRDLEIYEQNLPQTVEDIYHRWEDRFCSDMQIQEDEHYGWVPDYSDFIEDVRTLIDKISKIPIPEDNELRGKIKDLVNSYKTDFLGKQLEQTLATIEEAQKEEKKIKSAMEELPKI